mgnify:CR=1 FL=1
MRLPGLRQIDGTLGHRRERRRTVPEHPAGRGGEDRLGSITPGKLADLVVLDRDPLAIDPQTLDQVTPTRTMLGGEWVWTA